MIKVKERLVKKALLRITFCSRREMGELLTGCLLSAMLMFWRFAQSVMAAGIWVWFGVRVLLYLSQC